MLTVVFSLVFTDTFADSFTVNFDKQIYAVNDSLTISGKIVEIEMPVIVMSVYDPDGKILSANNLEISSEKTFSKTFFLNSPFYEKIGEYLIKLDYGKVSENHYFIIDGESFDSEVLTESFDSEVLTESFVHPQIISLYTKQKQYTDNDVIEINGQVSILDSPSVLMGIYDPFGMPAGFYFGSVDSNLEFTTSFLVKDGVNFRIDGIYSIKAHYADSEIISFFEYSKNPHMIIDDTNVDDTNVDDTNVDDTNVDDTNVDDTNVDDTNVDDTNVDDTNVDDTNVDDTNVDDTNVDDTNVDDTNVDDTNVDDTNVDDTNVDDTNVDDTNVDDTNVDDTNVDDTNVDDTNVDDTKYGIEKQNNLTVDDIELGKLLNQINLKCDSSIFVDTISYYDGMGPALYRLCEFDNALNFFNESLMDDPNNVEILVNKGSTLGKLGYFSEAIIYYDHAINIDPNFLPAKNNKANAFANMNNLDSSILLYNEILIQNSDYLTAQKNLNSALSLVSDLSEDFSEDYSQNTSNQNISSQNIISQQSHLSEKVNMVDSQKQQSNNIFDEVSIVFSTLGSLFDFLN